jgi:hypothetical protein
MGTGLSCKPVWVNIRDAIVSKNHSRYNATKLNQNAGSNPAAIGDISADERAEREMWRSRVASNSSLRALFTPLQLSELFRDAATDFVRLA